MSNLHNLFKTTRLSIWLLVCVLILAATSVYAAGDQRPLAAVDVLGSPDAAVDGKFAVGTATPGNKTLTVAGVIDFVGAGSVHNYFTQGPGNNMQIRSNVDEYNAVGNSSYAQWNMVMGASLDVFSIRRSPAGSTYNEDALFWIEGSTGNVGIAKVDTGNGATIPFTLQARLHVDTDAGFAIWAESYATTGSSTAVYGRSYSTEGRGVVGIANASTGMTIGVHGSVLSTEGYGVYGTASATTGGACGVYGQSSSNNGRGVYGYAGASSGSTYGVQGVSFSTAGTGVYGGANSTTGTTYGVEGTSVSNSGRGVYGVASSTSGSTYGVYGRAESSAGTAVFGWAAASSGTTFGVRGTSSSTDGQGVYGYVDASSGSTYGVVGRTNSTGGRGVYGEAMATSGGGMGVTGVSHASAGMGVLGQNVSSSGTNYGVVGNSASTTGFDFYAFGSGTDYGPFTGAHEVLLAESFPTEVKPGMIVSGTGQAHLRLTDDGDVDLSSTLPTVKLAESAEDNAVLGVLVGEITLPDGHWYSPAAGDRFASVNALGEGRVWVTDVNGEIKVGDAITSSAIPGYGQRQSDDILHIYTLGKATETVDWDSVTDTVIFNGQEYKVYLLAVVYTSG